MQGYAALIRLCARSRYRELPNDDIIINREADDTTA